MNISFIIVRVALAVSSTLIDSSLFVTFYTGHTGHAYNLFAPRDRTTTEQVPKGYHTAFKHRYLQEITEESKKLLQGV
jgi:hypothetical protein